VLDAAPSDVSAAMQNWAGVREKVTRVADAFADAPWRAYATTDAATGADDPEADERADETLAPRARLFGRFVATIDPALSDTYVGVVADEWAEQRPSRMQYTGIAVNYDSPQSEPPQVLLLCEPSGPRAAPWTPSGAAAMVGETIRLMKARALAAQDRPLDGPLLPFANQVPFKETRRARGGAKPRVPVRRLKEVPTGAVRAEGMFVMHAMSRDVGVTGRGLTEITGFSKIEE